MLRAVSAGVGVALTLLLVGYDVVSAEFARDRHEQGRAVYNYRCYFCHGYSGDARTLAATYLEPRPRDFTASTMDVAAIRHVLREGRIGTAMKSYAGILNAQEIDSVAAFVEREFIREKAPNTRYHTAANGWPDHERFSLAFPFARGEIALDTAVESLDATQRAARQLFLTSCISCHDRAHVRDEGPAWSSRPVSFPRIGFVPDQSPIDAVSSASVYAKHDLVPEVGGLTRRQQQGRKLYQANCAFCHAADGTGKNWIGQFMEPKARDLTQYRAETLSPARLKATIRDGLPGTSMPAWRHVLTPAETEAIADYVSRAFFDRPPGPSPGGQVAAGDPGAPRR